MKKLIAPLFLAAALMMTGCAGGSAPAASNSEPGREAPVEEAPQVPDLTGAWTQSNKNSEDSYQQATITGDTITVEWVLDGGDTTSTYWVGTFDAPTDESEPYTFTSERDAVATDAALMASTDDTKDFMYEGETVSYKVTALGTTMTVKLKKN